MFELEGVREEYDKYVDAMQRCRAQMSYVFWDKNITDKEKLDKLECILGNMASKSRMIYFHID